MVSTRGGGKRLLRSLHYPHFLFPVIGVLSFFSYHHHHHSVCLDACSLIASALCESRKAKLSERGELFDGEDAGEQPIDGSTANVMVHPSYMLKAHSRIPDNHNDQVRLLTVSVCVCMFILHPTA